MSTLVVHLDNKAQEKAVKAVLEALQITFEQEIDDTEYIISSPNMIARIEQSKSNLENGKGVKVDLNNLWK
ncbi:MAG: hypothetical protein EOP41_09495 [Sphingobacteriaceae bacterium]|nr:MAG: hypothetical protein EOP41_09495 [Sphingobacteriaceae bacterium]